MRYLVIFCMLLFLPAWGQTSNGYQREATILRSQIEDNYNEMATIVDSMRALSRRASIVLHDNTDYEWRRNVDMPNGRRVWWIFKYQIKDNKWTGGKDTLFSGVEKLYTYWK